MTEKNKANLRDLIAATGLVILLKLDSNRRFFSRVNFKFDGWPRQIRGHLFYTTSSFVHHFKSISEFKLKLQPGNAQLGSIKIDDFFLPCDLEIWRMTLKNNRAPLLCYFKLCASFRSHWWIQTGVTVRKRPIWVKIDDFSSRVTLKFDGWPWKTIVPHFYATSRFVPQFIAICKFKLELQSGNAQFGSKSVIFFVACDLEIWRVTLKYNRVPLQCGSKLCASFDSNRPNHTGVTVRKCQNRWFFVSCDHEIRRMTLKNNRAPLLCYFKLCA